MCLYWLLVHFYIVSSTQIYCVLSIWTIASTICAILLQHDQFIYGTSGCDLVLGIYGGPNHFFFGWNACPFQNGGDDFWNTCLWLSRRLAWLQESPVNCIAIEITQTLTNRLYSISLRLILLKTLMLPGCQLHSSNYAFNMAAYIMGKMTNMGMTHSKYNWNFVFTHA